jgi:hypothetical protein
MKFFLIFKGGSSKENRAEKQRLRKAAGRYRKPYDDSANMKQADMKQTFLDNITERLTARPTRQRNEVLFFADPHFLFFNFIASAHCTHLPLLADTQANPKAKSKECNRQRTVRTRFYHHEQYFLVSMTK